MEFIIGAKSTRYIMIQWYVNVNLNSIIHRIFFYSQQTITLTSRWKKRIKVNKKKNTELYKVSVKRSRHGVHIHNVYWIMYCNVMSVFHIVLKFSFLKLMPVSYQLLHINFCHLLLLYRFNVDVSSLFGRQNVLKFQRTLIIFLSIFFVLNKI
jgi:hypothetical protein